MTSEDLFNSIACKVADAKRDHVEGKITFTEYKEKLMEIDTWMMGEIEKYNEENRGKYILEWDDEDQFSNLIA